MLKFNYSSIAALLTLCVFPGTGYLQTTDDNQGFSVGSFNVHYVSPRRPKLPWEERRDAVAEAVNELNADIIGFQEMETFIGRGERTENIQLKWVLENSSQYAAAAIGDPELYPSTQPILYRPNLFEPLEQGFFFFSETPDEIYSRPWDPSFASFASWVQFADLNSGQSFRVVNVHFDHSSKLNRHNSAQLVADRIEPWLNEQESVIVLGDFNALTWFKPINTLKSVGMEVADTEGSTFHFNRGLNLFPAIDHVLYSGFEEIGETLRLNKQYQGVWPSDHYPIKVALKFKEEEPGFQVGGLQPN
jgi:endonuclease/exonuclease/phosphatase family metal-dependent hydrolase